MSPSVVTIDGPAASGKSTAARGVAERLGFRHLNSGLLYRAVTWAAVRGGWTEEGRRFRRELEELELELVPGDGGYDVRVDGVEPGGELRSDAVVDRVSEIAARGPVRERVTSLVRREGERRDLVCDGRDMGTVVFPGAELKVFLVASPEERARRRILERGGRPTPDRLREEAERIRARDEHDSRRALSPLRRASDAVELDTTELSPEEVVDRIVEEVRKRGLA